MVSDQMIFDLDTHIVEIYFFYINFNDLFVITLKSEFGKHSMLSNTFDILFY